MINDNKKLSKSEAQAAMFRFCTRKLFRRAQFGTARQDAGSLPNAGETVNFDREEYAECPPQAGLPSICWRRTAGWT